MKKKILLSLDAWYPQVAGPNIVVTNYYRHLNENGNDCRIVVPSYGKKKDAAANALTKFEPLRCKGMHLPIGEGGGFCDALPSQDKKLKRFVKEFQPDILHSHSPFNLGKFYAEVGKKISAPSIFTFHTKFRDEFLRLTKSKVLTRYMMKRIMKAINLHDFVWTVSNGSAETLREYGYKGEITVVRNGTDMTVPENPEELVDWVNREYGLTDCENVMLFVGRIVAVKNLELVFRALQKVKERSKLPFKMVVVGNGLQLNDYKKQAEELGISDRVIFTGEITDRTKLKGFYLRANLFVFASEFDTASLCPLEAAAFSLPTLLVRDCPTSETIRDGVSGFCEVNDSDAWAEKIIEIFSDRNKLEEVGANARKFVYRSWQDVVNEVENKYDEILSRTGGGRLNSLFIRALFSRKSRSERRSSSRRVCNDGFHGRRAL